MPIKRQPSSYSSHSFHTGAAKPTVTTGVGRHHKDARALEQCRTPAVRPGTEELCDLSMYQVDIVGYSSNMASIRNPSF